MATAGSAPLLPDRRNPTLYARPPSPVTRPGTSDTAQPTYSEGMGELMTERMTYTIRNVAGNCIEEHLSRMSAARALWILNEHSVRNGGSAAAYFSNPPVDVDPSQCRPELPRYCVESLKALGLWK